MAWAFPRHGAREATDSQHSDRHSLQQARKVQDCLQAHPYFQTRSLDCVALSAPAHGVGGDWFDFLRLSARRSVLVVADVAGNGVPAALLMAHLQATLRSDYTLAEGALEVRLQRINRDLLTRVAPGHFATLFVAEYDDFTGRLRYANCGHVPPMLLRGDGGISVLASTATVLGLFEDWPCSVGEIELVPGDLLLACTDGVTEAQDAAGNEFGADRIVDVARAAHQQALPELVNAIAEAVWRFAGTSPLDDLTLVAVRRRHPAQPQALRPCALGNVLRTRNRSGPCSST